MQIGPVGYRTTDLYILWSFVAPTSTRNDFDYVLRFWELRIMYVKILGHTTTDGTMVPTPPRKSAEALSRWTLLWILVGVE